MNHLLAAGTNTDQVSSQTAWYILAFLSIGGAFGVILMRKAVHCVLMLALVMLCLSVMYAIEGAPFLAFAQVIVYTGAVLMLFLFVLMLIGVSSTDSIKETIRGQRLWAGLCGIALIVLLVLAVGHASGLGQAAPETAAQSSGNLTGLATLIFTTYVFPFEVTSALLLAAALGAMVLAHRERITPKPTQLDLARKRVAAGDVVSDPPPGVYALHDGVDMPALLPDGTTSAKSVSAAIVQRDLDLGIDPGQEVEQDLEAIASTEGSEQ
jgi:NADH-quinone oxidoreductase subunit J